MFPRPFIGRSPQIDQNLIGHRYTNQAKAQILQVENDVNAIASLATISYIVLWGGFHVD